MKDDYRPWNKNMTMSRCCIILATWSISLRRQTSVDKFFTHVKFWRLIKIYEIIKLKNQILNFQFDITLKNQKKEKNNKIFGNPAGQGYVGKLLGLHQTPHKHLQVLCFLSTVVPLV